MFLGAFFSWWYGPGWTELGHSFASRLNHTAALFSVNQLLRTLFSPWRRIISYPGASLEDKLRAWGDNLFSRVIGFIVRLIVLLTSLVVIVLVMLLSLIEFLAWPLLPIAIVGGIVAGALS